MEPLPSGRIRTRADALPVRYVTFNGCLIDNSEKKLTIVGPNQLAIKPIRTMKKMLALLSLTLGLLIAQTTVAQDAKPKKTKAKTEMSAADKSAKDAAKAEKKAAKDAAKTAKADAKSTQDDATRKAAATDRMAAARAAKAAKKADADKMTTDASMKADKAGKKADKMADNAGMKADKMDAKASKKADKMTSSAGMKDDKMSKSATMDKPKADKMAKATKPAMKEEKASPADYKAPVDRSSKGPNGEVVRTGPRGGKYYINKNGNKTYLSSLK